MKEVFLLTKILFKSSFNNNPKKNKIGKFLGFGLIYLYIAGVVSAVSFEGISALKTINQEAVFINLCMVSIFMFIIMRALFTSINVLFFSKDIEFLLPLPIKTYKIVMAKLNYLIISEYFICGVVLVPALITYGILMKLNLWFYILSLIILVFLPIIPVVFISLLFTIIMKFTNVFKNKDFVQYITIVLVLVLCLSLSGVTSTNSQMTEEQLASMLVQANGLIEVYTQNLPVLKPVMNSIINYNTWYGVKELIVFLLESIASYAVVILIASKFYINTVVNSAQSKPKKKFNNIDKIFKQITAKKTYIKKEWKNLIRNPIYFMQCVMPSILFPLLVLGTTFMTFKEMGALEAENPFKTLNIETSSGFAIVFAIMVFSFMFNFVSITAVSRDGKQAIFMKYIPIKLQQQCLYKIMPGIILNIFPIIYTLIGVKLLMPQVSLFFMFGSIVVAMLFNIFNNYLMIIIDLTHPKLEWLTEYAVVKQNFNMVYEMITYMLEAIIIVILGLVIKNLLVFVLMLVTFGTIFSLKIKKYIDENEEKLFEQII